MEKNITDLILCSKHLIHMSCSNVPFFLIDSEDHSSFFFEDELDMVRWPGEFIFILVYNLFLYSTLLTSGLHTH